MTKGHLTQSAPSPSNLDHDVSFRRDETPKLTPPAMAIRSPYVDSPYLTLDEAAAYARVSKRTVQRWLDGMKLTRFGHGRRPLILKSQLEALLSSPHPDHEGVR